MSLLLYIIIKCFSLVSGFLYASSETCFDELGCFSNDGPFFHYLYRPINLLPDSRKTINTQFILHTRANPVTDQYLKVGDDFELTHFNPGNPIKFIVHGFTDSGFRPWIKDMTKNLLLRGDYNVITVDWAGGAINRIYMQSTANTRVVAAEIVLLINYLQNSSAIELENIHLIGHSLGAHISGYVGDRVKNIGRISGLDPAELYFQGLDPVVHLDPMDANFVDVIHTDSKSILMLGLGMIDPIGHVDFYPNGGSDQPGCDKSFITSILGSGVGSGSYNYIACSHMRSYEYYSESISSSDSFYGVECSNYGKFLNGKCNCGQDGEKCGVMGFNAAPKSGRKLIKYYLITDSKSPFQNYQYQVTVNLSNAEEFKSEQGILHLQLYQNDGKIVNRMPLSKESVTILPGQSLTFLINRSSKLGELSKLNILWEHDSSLYNPLSWNIFRKPKIFIREIIISPISLENSITFCGSPVGIKANEKMSMEVC